MGRWRLLRRVGFGIAAVTLLSSIVVAAQAPRPGYDVDYIGPPLADPVVQHAKETYVLYGCAYCHGVDLVPRGEAADLRQSAIVARDVNANLLGPLLRAGIPQTAKLSPMPQFSDLSDQQIGALALWIHYARARARYAAITAAPTTGGVASRGQADVEQRCASCHSSTLSLAQIAKQYDATTLRANLLRPPALNREVSYRLDRLGDTQAVSARQQHQALLENFTAEQVSDLVAYLQTLK